MISVIVPVYNVEPHLRKCLDSILAQTYRDLEILVIDDGSTDGSGTICDEYSEKDGRVRVFHTENKGLSCARNLGLDEAQGVWIGFVDSDDWIEPDMYEKAVTRIGSADVLCNSEAEGLFTNIEALAMHINRAISAAVWEKLYRKECFSSIRFPEGRVYEDIAITYKILYKAQRIACYKSNDYHYRKRRGSITDVHNMANIEGYWVACKERFDFYFSIFPKFPPQLRDQIYINLHQSVGLAIARAWGWRWANHTSASPEWEKMSQAAKTMFLYEIKRKFPLRIRIGLFFARFNYPFSFWAAHQLLILSRSTGVQWC